MENRKATEAGQDVTMQKEDFAALWKTIHLKVTDTYEVPPEILWVNGSTIGTLGNFSASTGKAKSKKTFNISAIVAAALKNDEVLKYSAYLPPNKRKILYVDTEQSKSGYLMRHSIRRISVFKSPIASSIRCRWGIFFLLKPYTIRFKTVQTKGKIT